MSDVEEVEEQELTEGYDTKSWHNISKGHFWDNLQQARRDEYLKKKLFTKFYDGVSNNKHQYVDEVSIWDTPDNVMPEEEIDELVLGELTVDPLTREEVEESTPVKISSVDLSSENTSAQDDDKDIEMIGMLQEALSAQKQPKSSFWSKFKRNNKSETE